METSLLTLESLIDPTVGGTEVSPSVDGINEDVPEVADGASVDDAVKGTEDCGIEVMSVVRVDVVGEPPGSSLVKGASVKSSNRMGGGGEPESVGPELGRREAPG